MPLYILTTSPCFQECQKSKHTRMVLRPVKDTSRALELRKRTFFKNKINTFDHIIRHDRAGVDNHTVDGIRELRTLTSVTEQGCF